MHDYKNRINREKLDIECQRASPKQWSKYAIATVVIKCLKAKEPTILYGIITETLYTERRYPHVGKFYSNARDKIVRQKLGNNLEFFNTIKDDWLGLDIGDDALRRMLKKSFVNYLTV